MATASATRAKTKARTGPATGGTRIDQRMCFAWLEETRSTYIYQGEECVLTHPGRKQIFRAPTLKAAVKAAIAVFPMKAK